MTTIDVELLRTDTIVFAEGVPVEEVIAELRSVGRQTSSDDPFGFAWIFPKHRSFDIFQHVDQLHVGVRGDVGTLYWSGESGSFVPTGGGYSHWVEYFTGGYENGVFLNADGVELPLDAVLDAVREYARTFQRPECVNWTDADELVEYPVPQTNTLDIYATPETTVDDVLTVLASQDRPRFWQLFVADETTEINRRKRGYTGRPPTLRFGLGTDDQGCMFWEDETGTYLPAHGESQSQETFSAGDSFTPAPIGSVVSNAEVDQAIRETVTTRQRPTCVEWTRWP